MDYSFQPFLDDLPDDWAAGDALLGRLLEHHAQPDDEAWARLRDTGRRAARRLSPLAERSALPENRPRLERHDAYSRRVDRVVLPESTREALALAEGREGLGAVHGDPFLFYGRVYLVHQNGEAGVACSMACTDGLVRVLEALGDRPEHRRAVERVRGSSRDRVWHGAQFVTEIQGGSDVPANRTRAVADGDAYRLHGQKWFCSNVNADYFLVTARPEGAPEDGQGIGLFLVPAYEDGEEVRRNGYTIDRLKEKLGTRELATAEVTFDGARAVPVGAPERGLSNLVRHVLVPSRFGCVISTAGFLRRAERIVETYTDFRTAFGRPLADYPLVRDTLADLRAARRRCLAAVFGLLARWEAGVPQPAADFRVLLSLCKPVLTRRSTAMLHEAMMLLGGNGIEEGFSPLPRLYRDATIMETWEGPHNVLLTQALRDLVRLELDPRDFVERSAGVEALREEGPDPERLADRLAELLSDPGSPGTTVAFGRWAGGMVRAFADHALREVGAA